MRLSSSVLGVLRGGVATASLMFTVACGTTAEPIQGEPAATLAPVATPQVAAPPIALPQAPPATLVPSAPIEFTPVAPLPPPAPPITSVTAPRQPRRPNRPAAPPPVVPQHPVSIYELPDQLDNIARPCGRG